MTRAPHQLQEDPMDLIVGAVLQVVFAAPAIMMIAGIIALVAMAMGNWPRR